jgi:hypothetical protein
MTPSQMCGSISLIVALALSDMPLLRASQDSARPKLTISGQIARVDTVLKSLEVKTQQEVNNQPTLADGITLGTRVGKTAPGQRSSIDPIDTSQPELPANFPRRPTVNDRGQSPAPPLRTTVFLIDTTVCKDGKKAMLCGELKVNDLVLVTGDEKSGPRGYGVYASDVVRTKQIR